MARGIGTESGWWCPSLDSSGVNTTTLTDLSSGGRNGTLTNMVTSGAGNDWVADTGSGGVRALDFDGTNDFVSIANTLAIPDAYTICGWVKIVSARATVLSFTGLDSNSRVSQWGTTGSRVPYFQLSLSGGYFFTTGGTALNAGQWYHLAFTRSGSAAKVFVDGVDTSAATSGGAVGSQVTNTNTRCIGRVTSSYSDARIDDVRIFPSVLSDATIAKLASKRGYERPIPNAAAVYFFQGF
jgi:hypothetical protein